MKKALLAFAAVTAAALPLAASAQLTANVTAISNYKFRGQDQDSTRNKALKPALQGGFDYAFGETGFYVGNWNSSVDFGAAAPNNSIESDFYGGYKMTAGDFALDFGALAYIYPGYAASKTVELYASGGWGPLVLKYSHTVSDDYFNYAGARSSNRSGRNTGYLNLAFAQEVAPSITVKAALGLTNFASDITAPNYADYSIGGAYDFGGGVSASAAIVGATKKNYFGDVNKARLIVGLTKAM